MEIHFCDLCNESVPESHLHEGLAFVRKGRVVCATCEELMSSGETPRPSALGAELAAAQAGTPGGAVAGVGLAAPPAPPPAFGAPPLPSGLHAPPAGPTPPRRAAEPVQVHGRSSAGTVLAGMLAIASMIFVAGVAWMLDEKLDAAQAGDLEDRTEQYELFEKNIQGVEQRVSSAVDSVRRETGAVSERLAVLNGNFEMASRGDAEALTSMRDQLAVLSGQLAILDGIGERQRDGQAERERLGQLIEALQGDVVLLSDALLELENRLVGVQAPEPLAPADGGAPGAGPAWMDLVDDLSSPNSGTRWTAVQDLGETGDPGVIKYLVPMVDDTDLFVRIATMRVLGELESPAAIPALIAGLEDEETSVREAALISLRDLSGQNFKFDPQASPSERERRVEAWRDWWKKNEKDLLGEG